MRPDTIDTYGPAVRQLAQQLGRRPGRKTIRARLGVSARKARVLAQWYATRSTDGEPCRKERPERGTAGDDGAQVTRTQHGEDAVDVSIRGQALVMSYEDLVRVANIDTAEWQCRHHEVNTWTTPMKGPDGRPDVVRNWQVKAKLERRVSTTTAPVQPVAPLPRRERPADPQRPTCTLMVPDSQHGFRWSEDRRRLLPLHDRRACDLVVQVAERLQPDRIVLLGDMMDLAEWSTRYPRPSELRDITQPTLAEVHAWLASVRQACPAAEIVYLEGNHEQRITRALVESCSPAAGLRGVDEDRAVLSVPRLLALDWLGIDYVGPYGEDTYIGNVRVTHGDKVRNGGGATAQAVIREATHSTWYGHIHRVELVHRTLHGPTGPRVIHAASPGCLCRVDGAVPGVTARPDWQQGIGVLWSDGADEHAEVRTITQGRMTWDGVTLHGEDRAQEYADATGWAAMA